MSVVDNDDSKASENPSTENEDPLLNATQSKDFDNPMQSSKEISDVMDPKEASSDAKEKETREMKIEQVHIITRIIDFWRENSNIFLCADGEELRGN